MQAKIKKEITAMLKPPQWLSGKESACHAGDTGQSLSLEDPLEKQMAACSNILD